MDEVVTLIITWLPHWGTFGAAASGTVWLGSAVGRGILPVPGLTWEHTGQKRDKRVLTAARTGNWGHRAWVPALAWLNRWGGCSPAASDQRPESCTRSCSWLQQSVADLIAMITLSVTER